MPDQDQSQLESQSEAQSETPAKSQSDAQTQPQTQSADLKPILSFLFLLPVAMAAAWWAGGEIANGEVSQYRASTLEQNTAKSKVLRVKLDVPPQSVITAEMLEVKETFQNRSEPDQVTDPAQAVGRKARYGLSLGQVLVENDLQ